MKTIDFKLVDEKIFYEKLDNGLDVYISYKKDFNSSFACFLTNFGGIDLEFIPIGEKNYIKMPSGIAHFLEHKLFEQENGLSVHEFYKKSGCYVNAMTSYKKTKYIINGPSNFKKNLEFLIKFVQEPYFTDENVEKERGIILEEARMCLDNKNRLFNETIYKNLYNEIRYDEKVIGSIEDIKNITKEDLYKCYNSFYHPSNMALFVVSNINEKEILDLIKKTQKNKKFDRDFKIIKKDYNETVEVRKEYEEMITDVMENRLCYSLKFKLSSFNAKKVEVYDYLYILLGILVGNLSTFNLSLKEQGIIKDNIGFSINSTENKDDSFLTVHIYVITDNEKDFIKLLEKRLKEKDYNEELFNLYKKNIISDFNYSFNSVNGIMSFMLSEYEFSNKIDNENLNEELNLNYNRFLEVIEKFNLNNKSIVIWRSDKNVKGKECK